MESDDTPHDDGRADRWVTLEFDFLKHLTSLSLAAVGGAVTFAGSLFAQVRDKDGLWLAVVLFAASGTTAFAGQHRLLKRLRSGAAPDRLVTVQRELSTGLLGLGAGALIGFAYEALR